MTTLQKDMYEFAYALVISAGTRLKAARKDSEVQISQKSSQMDIVTQHDWMVEEYLTQTIDRRYSTHRILAEEGHSRDDGMITGYTWVIDPIDGTMNYYRFSRDYAISLALYLDGKPVFGLIYDVAANVIYSGRSMEGASANGRKMEPMALKKDHLNKAVVAMSLRTMMDLSNMGMDVFDFLSSAQAHRYMGCASLELCRLASGEYDLYFSTNVYEWDIAAARVMIEQCGGCVMVRKREKTSDKPGKLYVAAFREQDLWNDFYGRLPVNLQDAFQS